MHLLAVELKSELKKFSLCTSIAWLKALLSKSNRLITIARGNVFLGQNFDLIETRL